MKFSQDNDHVLIQLYRGEDVFTCLEELAGTKGWPAGFVSGIGAIEDIEIGAYDLPNKTYFRKNLEGIYELASLQGNFSKVDGKPFFHLHGVISDHSLQALGGHFFGFKVAVSCEVKIRIFPKEVTREMDEETGLKLLNFCDIPST